MVTNLVTAKLVSHKCFKKSSLHNIITAFHGVNTGSNPVRVANCHPIRSGKGFIANLLFASFRRLEHTME
jgi:hypothetical protein